MSRYVFAVLVLCFGILSVGAAPKAPANMKAALAQNPSGSNSHGMVESKTPFSGDRLFAVLDSLGGTGTWMEWDINGVKDPTLMRFLNPMLSSKSTKPEMIWVIVERAKPMVAVLVPKGRGEAIAYAELNALDAAPVPLEINPVLSPDVVFRDYEQISETEFVHRDKPNLKVNVTSKSIRFTYKIPGEEPLRLDPDFATKTIVEKNAILRDFEDFFKYEYSLMLRAFVQSTRGIFNWQPWHWYMAQWNGKFMLQRSELEAILTRGFAPDYFTLFKAKTARGEVVEFKTNGAGYCELLITRP